MSDVKAIYICDQGFKRCKNKSSCQKECKHTANLKHAKYKYSVELLKTCLRVFNVVIDGETVIFVEKEDLE